MSTGFPVLVDCGEELVEIEPAARRGLGDNGVDLRGLEAEGLDILADCYVFHSGEGVIERIWAHITRAGHVLLSYITRLVAPFPA